MKKQLLYLMCLCLFCNCTDEASYHKQRAEISITFIEWASSDKIIKEFGHPVYWNFCPIIEYENRSNVPIFVPTDSTQRYLNSSLERHLVNKPGMGESYVAIFPHSKRRFQLSNILLFSTQSENMIAMYSFYTKELNNINKKWDYCDFLVPKNPIFTGSK